MALQSDCSLTYLPSTLKHSIMQKLLIFTTKRSPIYKYLVNSTLFAKIAETHLSSEFVYVGLMLPNEQLDHLLSIFVFRDYFIRKSLNFIELHVFDN